MPVLLKKFFIVILHQINAKALQQPGQQPNRQAHDVEKVTVNALHQQRALALHAVGAGLVHGLAGADVGAQLPLRGRAEVHIRVLGGGADLRSPAHGHAGTHRVLSSRQGREHLQGLGLVPGLTQAPLVQEYHGVRGDDDLVAPTQPRHGIRFLPGDELHDLLRG